MLLKLSHAGNQDSGWIPSRGASNRAGVVDAYVDATESFYRREHFRFDRLFLIS